MVDPKALSLWQKKDTVGLFQYLGPMWLKVCMETIWDLLPHGFYPHPDLHKAQLAAAGIFVERMEVALLAVYGKYARTTTWTDFESANQSRLTKLPPRQQEEVKEFWFAGPTPGLAGPSQVDYAPTASVPLDLNPGADFTVGFLEGLVTGMDANNYATLKSKLSASPLDFYGHYVAGIFKGFYEGMKGLVEGLFSLFKLALKLSPVGVVYSAIRAAVSESYRKEIAKDAEEAKAMAQAVLGVMEEFAKNPALYVGKSKSAGKIIGGALAREINEGVAAKSAAQLGDWVGEIVGRVLFEVILLIATEGIGTAVRTGAATGEVARIAARVADKLRDALEGLPALRRVFVKFLGESAGGVRLARWAERGALLRLPEGSGARAGGKLWREGATEAEEFLTRSGPKGSPAPRTDLTQPPRHVMRPEPIPEGQLNKGIPDHLKDLTPEQKRAWIETPEGKKWRETQRLDGPANNLETTSPHAGPRDHDAEANMFEDPLRKTNKTTTGEFHFKVDRPVCPACKDMIFRFAQERPGIKVIQHSL